MDLALPPAQHHWFWNIWQFIARQYLFVCLFYFEKLSGVMHLSQLQRPLSQIHQHVSHVTPRSFCFTQGIIMKDENASKHKHISLSTTLYLIFWNITATTAQQIIDTRQDIKWNLDKPIPHNTYNQSRSCTYIRLLIRLRWLPHPRNIWIANHHFWGNRCSGFLNGLCNDMQWNTFSQTLTIMLKSSSIFNMIYCTNMLNQIKHKKSSRF